jgi:hypothetical protein
MEPTDKHFDDELASLARETLRVAESITEPEIRNRLIQISNEMFELAFPKRGYS